MTRQPNIIEHLPLFLQRYREMKEITDAENIELQSIISQSEIIKDNQFITSCDSDGIKRFEKILGIATDESESLEQRKFKVLLYWSSYSHYTLQDLITKLNDLGAGNYKLQMDFASYTLTILLSPESFIFYDILKNFVKKLIPMNIIVIWKLWIESYSELKMEQETSTKLETQLSNPESISLDGSFNFDGKYKLTNPLLIHETSMDVKEVY